MSADHALRDTALYSEHATHPPMIPPRAREEDLAGSASPALWRMMTEMMAREQLHAMQTRLRIGTRARVIAGGFVGSAAPYATERSLIDPASRVPLERVPTRLRAGTGVVALRWKEAALPAVTIVFNLLAQGADAAAVARTLTEKGFPPPEKAVRWTGKSVLRIARNPIYAGDFVYGRSKTRGQAPVLADQADRMDHTPIRVPDFMPRAPISREQFERVQGILGRRARMTGDGQR